MNYGTAAPVYVERGWTTPFPLPRNAKFPPPDDCTGNIPEVKASVVEDWIDTHENHNLGLRMPRIKIDGEDWEVIGIDVDQYAEKNGFETFSDFSQKYGALPDTWRSSSRDEDNPSGIYFFLVPAGKKWEGKLGDDVEIIQRTHRYAASWPSQVIDAKAGNEKRVYQWFQVTDLDEIGIPPTAEQVDGPPSVIDLPYLPMSWQKRLLKGDTDSRHRVGKVKGLDSVRDARAWLQKNIPGYDKLPSSEMARVSNIDALSMEVKGGAHDMIVNRLHQVTMLAVEGHHGLLCAIEAIQRVFQEEVTGELSEESARRSLPEMRAEFQRALLGEVTKLRQDIDAGYVTISTIGGFTAEDLDTDIGGLRQQIQAKVLDKLVKRRSRAVELDSFDDSDLGRGKMFLASLEEEIQPIAGGSEWAFWNDATFRLEQLQMKNLTRLWEQVIIDPHKEAAKTAFNLADVQEEQGLDTDSKATRKKAADYDRRAKLAGNKSTIYNGLELAHTMSDNGISLDSFDKNPRTLGVENGVIEVQEGDNEEMDPLRRGTREDLIFLNTSVNYRESAKHELWTSYLDTFLPDLDYRKFVQKIFGYSLMGGNPQRLIVFLQGGTSTGKSTILAAVQAALGGKTPTSYAATVNANALFREKQDAGPAPEMLKALPKRIVMCSEVGSHNRLHADVIKRLTGGDAVSARALYSNEVQDRTPMFTPIIATNSMPTIQDGDTALWRRIMVLPFDHSVPQETVPHEKISDTPEALEAVLAWLVEGWMDYMRDGLGRSTWPKLVLERNRDFIVGTSEFQTFLSDHTKSDKDGKIEVGKLYQFYQSWCASEGMRSNEILTKTMFTGRMTANGVGTRRTTIRVKGKKNPVSKTVFYGIQLIGKEIDE